LRQIGKGWFETKIDELCKWIETREEMFEKTQETVNVEIDRLKGNMEALEKCWIPKKWSWGTSITQWKEI
jgi:hypothetical protein